MTMKRIAALFAVSFATCLSGCVGIYSEEEKDINSGRHEKVVASLEAKHKGNIQALSQLDLVIYCEGVVEARLYDKFTPCISELKRRPRESRGEKNDYGNMELKLQTIYALDTGDFKTAVRLARAWKEYAWSDDRRGFGRGYFNASTMEIDSLGAAALAHVFAGDRAAGLRYLAELSALPIRPLTAYQAYAALVQAHIIRAHVSLGNYKSALDVARNDAIATRRNVQAAFGWVQLFFPDTPLGAWEKRETRAAEYVLHKLELEVGETAKAKAGFDALLADPVTREAGDIHWYALYDRGRIAERERDTSRAIQLYKEAADIIESRRSRLNTEAGKIGFIGSKQAVYHDLIRLLMRERRVAEALDYVERAKARALVDMLASKKAFSTAPGSERRVQELLASADAAEMSTSTATDSQKATRNLAVEKRKELSAISPELASLVSVSTASASTLQRLLSSDETLLEYFYSGNDLHVFMVTADRIAGVTLPAANLDSDVAAFRRAIQEGGDAWREWSNKLYARLIRPIQGELRTSRVIIVPHGALHYLPFSALGDGKRLFVENYSIRFLPAASVLQYAKAKVQNKPGGILAFGNPDLGDSRFDLAHAQREAEVLAKALPNSRALLRRAATKQAFRTYASDFQIIHIASHGTFDPENPLASALLLSPTVGDDGRLTVSDLYSMRVDTDLVTLSACETGLGKVANGDDVVGLTRGFMYAGARTIVASLWKVDDQATAYLMERFYQGLTAGLSKRDALRQAQLESLKSRPHPFFWAAFQVSGNP